ERATLWATLAPSAGERGAMVERTGDGTVADRPERAVRGGGGGAMIERARDGTMAGADADGVFRAERGEMRRLSRIRIDNRIGRLMTEANELLSAKHAVIQCIVRIVDRRDVRRVRRGLQLENVAGNGNDDRRDRSGGLRIGLGNPDVASRKHLDVA